jgi:hypothetical protein
MSRRFKVGNLKQVREAPPGSQIISTLDSRQETAVLCTSTTMVKKALAPGAGKVINDTSSKRRRSTLACKLKQRQQEKTARDALESENSTAVVSHYRIPPGQLSRGSEKSQPGASISL